MTARLRHQAAIWLFVLLCSLGALSSVWQISGWRDYLSDVDAYSEANALREVHNWFEHGFAGTSGLGNVYHDGMYPRDGFARDPEDAKYSLTPEGVYTHYPPGPEYLLYAAEKLFGPEPVWRLRLSPIAIGWAAMLFLGFAVRRRFGAMVGWLVMGACAITPSVTDAFAGLHYQGYALALLMAEIAVAIGYNARLAPFALLGFAQGWLSFDYVFLVALTPLALELVLSRIDPGHSPRWKLATARSLLAAGGFGVAIGMHFLQVWDYFGSFGMALHDFGGAAAHRAGTTLISGPIQYLRFVMGILKLYICGLHPLNLSLELPEPGMPENWSMFRFLGLSLGPWWVLVTIGMLLWDRLRPGVANQRIRMDWHFVCVTGIVTSSVWLVVMLDHAGHHRHFLYRHLFFAFFVVVLFGAVSFSRVWAKSKDAGSFSSHRSALSIPES